jgi:hypothetical protein
MCDPFLLNPPIPLALMHEGMKCDPLPTPHLISSNSLFQLILLLDQFSGRLPMQVLLLVPQPVGEGLVAGQQLATCHDPECGCALLWDHLLEDTLLVQSRKTRMVSDNMLASYHVVIVLTGRHPVVGKKRPGARQLHRKCDGLGQGKCLFENWLAVATCCSEERGALLMDGALYRYAGRMYVRLFKSACALYV